MAHQQNSLPWWNASIIWETVCKFFVTNRRRCTMLGLAVKPASDVVNWNMCSVFPERAFMKSGRIIALANLYWGIHAAGLLAPLQQTEHHVQNGKIPAFSVLDVNAEEAIACSWIWALVLQLWLFFLIKECRKPKLPWRIRIKIKEVVFQILFFICYCINIFKYCPYLSSIKINDSHFKQLRCFKYKVQYVDLAFGLLISFFPSRFINFELIINKPGIEHQLSDCNFDRQTNKGFRQYLEAP